LRRRLERFRRAASALIGVPQARPQQSKPPLRKPSRSQASAALSLSSQPREIITKKHAKNHE
jgi:hypothetical protein